ncbi:hypothetical protein GLW00_12200 [Halobacillus litoralis]|uniref:HTH hxlR-type domain-containing protein n=1 Tax=Halobacillus litoralis TaxID=45668 RepID=A0A845FCF9_9BACI|nr:hypothetical protein [Halobacillus litoralis]
MLGEKWKVIILCHLRQTKKRTKEKISGANIPY